MKVISLWQPWASLIAVGAKRIETRHWSTNYRGPLAIHAAKSTAGREYMEDLADYLPPQLQRWEQLPLGAIVCAGVLKKVSRTEDIAAALDPDPGPFGSSVPELALGNYGPGRFGWLLERVVRIEPPIECAGRQGLWDIPDSAFPSYVLEALHG